MLPATGKSPGYSFPSLVPLNIAKRPSKMKIYVDARCLQDENYAFRGVGYHSSTLLKAGRGLLAEQTALVGLIDPGLPSLSENYTEFFDQITEWQSASKPEQGSAFIQLSPMTHDQSVCGRFLDRKGILTARAACSASTGSATSVGVTSAGAAGGV